MITILSMLEAGYESSFEHLAFRQLKGAFYCNLACVPHDYPTMQGALDAVSGTKIFMMPPGRSERSTEFADFVLPEGDVAFVLGSPQDSLLSYANRASEILHITTPGGADMMSVSVAAIILYVHG